MDQSIPPFSLQQNLKAPLPEKKCTLCFKKILLISFRDDLVPLRRILHEKYFFKPRIEILSVTPLVEGNSAALVLAPLNGTF